MRNEEVEYVHDLRAVGPFGVKTLRCELLCQKPLRNALAHKYLFDEQVLVRFESDAFAEFVLQISEAILVFAVLLLSLRRSEYLLFVDAVRALVDLRFLRVDVLEVLGALIVLLVLPSFLHQKVLS